MPPRRVNGRGLGTKEQALTHAQDIPVGLCQCGCGQQTRLAKQSDTKLGYVRGRPHRFIAGHNMKRTPHDYEEHDRGYRSPCWEWARYRDKMGYGRVGNWTTGSSLAHVRYWVARNGPVPPGLELDHLCENPPCVNPDHLEPVTHTENIRRCGHTTLTLEQVRYIKRCDESALVLAERFGVTRTNIYRLRLGLIWKDA